MGCLIAFRCRPDSQTGDLSTESFGPENISPDGEIEPDLSESEYRTNPDACLSTPYDTLLSSSSNNTIRDG